MTSFSTIYRRYSRDVYRFVYWLSGSAGTAEDITAETFARAWAGADNLRAETVKAYLLTIARNLYLEQVRRHREVGDLDDELVDPAPTPERSAIGRSRLARVTEALADLPEVDRTALFLRVDEGLAYRQIAQALGLSLSAAKVKVHRARLRLAARLEQKEKAS